MAKSDTWPGGIAMETLSNMDSAGSCDSVISMNSGFVSSSCLWPCGVSDNRTAHFNKPESALFSEDCAQTLNSHMHT